MKICTFCAEKINMLVKNIAECSVGVYEMANTELQDNGVTITQKRFIYNGIKTRNNRLHTISFILFTKTCVHTVNISELFRLLYIYIYQASRHILISCSLLFKAGFQDTTLTLLQQNASFS